MAIFWVFQPQVIVDKYQIKLASLFPSISVILFKRLLKLKEADTDETIP
jgi:hypothetical protein